LATILKMRKHLADTLEVEVLGRPVAGPAVGKLLTVCAAILPGSVDQEALKESVRCMTGRIPTRQDLDLLAYRLVGNLDRLKMHRPVTPWVTQPVNEKVLAQVIAYRPELRSRLTTRFTIQLMSGLPAGLRTQVWWDLPRCGVVASIAGFDRPAQVIGGNPKPHLYAAPPQLVGLYGEVLIDGTESSKTGVPTIAQFRCPNHLKAVNRHLLRLRFRVTPGHDCPRGYPITFPCHYCPVGYVECPAAVHEQHYVVAYCKGCDDATAPFDPDWTLDKCVNCVIKDAQPPI